LPKTKRGIYHNLRESTYTVSNSEIVFFFSSMVYLHKFLEGYKENRDLVQKRFGSLSDGIFINTDLLADVHYYEQIEKRGCYAKRKGSAVSCPELYQYALQNLTNKNTNDWQRTPNGK